jgi:serine/threonine protein kinase
VAEDRSSWGLRAGSVVGRGHRVVRALGGGKRTEVLLATDDGGAGRVVVKVLRPGQSEAALRALAGEAAVVGSLEHATFPRLVAAELDAQPPHIVLEHLDGPRLSTRLRRRGPLPVGEAVELAAGLVDGIRYLHGRGFVHLDVKPSNTILSGWPRIIDLGVARSAAAAARTHGVVGSHRFQSPEQHHVEVFGGLTPRADVWGIAITVLTALRGGSPFGPLRDAHDQRRVLTRDDVAAIALPRHVPAELASVLRDALAWSPQDRPTAAELADRLTPLAATIAVGPSSAGMPRRTHDDPG